MNGTPPSADRPFFIGWETRPLPAFLRWLALGAIAGCMAIAGLISTTQSHIGPATWDFAVTEHRGVLLSHPVPLLLESTGGTHVIRFLVKPEKFGFTRNELEAFHLKPVTLQASLLQNGPRSMLEVTPRSIVVSTDAPSSSASLPPLTPVAQMVTLRGEIIDSKCYLGAMNPGERKTHRACAIHCLRGGIPAAFLVRDGTAQEQVLLLTGRSGESINTFILDFVAEPVEATGTLSYAADLQVFAIDPASLRRLERPRNAKGTGTQSAE